MFMPWWVIVIALLAAPFVYKFVCELAHNGKCWFELDDFLFFIISWSLALGILIGQAVTR